MKMSKLTNENSAFVLVDYQNDFVDEWWTLCVKWAKAMESSINSIVELFGRKWISVIATKDFHPTNHISFAQTHWVDDFAQVDGELKWPVHCVANQWGSELYKRLESKTYSKIVYKWTNENEDAYSGFKWTDLDLYLRWKEIENLFVGGVATDFCVNETVLDAKKLGYNVFVVNDLIKPVYPESVQSIFENWTQEWIVQLSSLHLIKLLNLK